MQTLLTEVARVRAHGFSAREVEIACTKLSADIESSYMERDQAYATDVRDEYVRCRDSGPQQCVSMLELWLSLLGRILAAAIIPDKASASIVCRHFLHGEKPSHPSLSCISGSPLHDVMQPIPLPHHILCNPEQGSSWSARSMRCASTNFLILSGYCLGAQAQQASSHRC